MKSEDMTEEILAKLNAFGDSLLEGGSSSQVNSKKRKKDNPLDQESRNDGNEKRRKKKKKKNQEQSGTKASTAEINHSKHLKGEKKHLAELRAHLGLCELDTVACSGGTDDASPPAVSPGFEQPAKSARRAPQVIVFEDPAKRKEKRLANSKATSNPTTGTSGDRDTHQEDEVGVMFDLKRARHEIKRLGISGLDKKAKEEAQIQLAVKLGAKPPKNPYLNYRELQENKKKKQEEERNQNKEDNVTAKTSQGVSKSKRPKSRKNSLGHIDGQIGSYKNGIQKISKDDIHKINKSNKKNR